MSTELDYNHNFLSPEVPSFRPITQNYSIVSADSGEYVADKNGNLASSFYHQISRYSFQDDQYVANYVLGRSGATWRVLSYNHIDKDKPWFLAIGDGFHQIEVRSDLNHKTVGTLGAFDYILGNNFRKSHRGYNSLRWDNLTDTYYGTIDDIEEKIVLNPSK